MAVMYHPPTLHDLDGAARAVLAAQQRSLSRRLDRFTMMQGEPELDAVVLPLGSGRLERDTGQGG